MLMWPAVALEADMYRVIHRAGRCMGSALERELAELVAAKQVHARIDSHAKVLYARLADPRSATFANALRIGPLPRGPDLQNSSSTYVI